MKTVRVLRSTVASGKPLVAGESYELSDKDANILVSFGRAVIDGEAVEPMKAEEDLTERSEDLYDEEFEAE